MGWPLAGARLQPAGLAGFALSGFAMGVHVERWTGSAFAGLVAGCLSSFNAHQLVRFAHLQALHVQFFPIVARRVRSGSRRSGSRAAVTSAALFVLQALCSNYTMVFISTALIVRASSGRSRGIRRCSTVVALAVAGVVSRLSCFRSSPLLPRPHRAGVGADHRRRPALFRAGSITWSRRDGSTFASGATRFFGGRTALFPGFTAVRACDRRGQIGRRLARSAARAWHSRLARSALPSRSGRRCPATLVMHAYLPLLQGVRAAARWGTAVPDRDRDPCGFWGGAARSRWRCPIVVDWRSPSRSSGS